MEKLASFMLYSINDAFAMPHSIFEIVFLLDLFHIFSSWSIKLWDSTLMMSELRGKEGF